MEDAGERKKEERARHFCWKVSEITPLLQPTTPKSLGMNLGAFKSFTTGSAFREEGQDRSAHEERRRKSAARARAETDRASFSDSLLLSSRDFPWVACDC